ncbi:MAG: hypothetical protein ABI824_03960 [Acidobacteriota bacterium]
MRRLPMLTGAFLALTMMLLGTGCSYLKARDRLNKGVAAFRSGKFGDAAEFFKEAEALDPTWDNPKLYLATSYLSQWTPGAASPENLEFLKKAREGFLNVLETSPKDETALASMATMAYNQATTGTFSTLAEKIAKLDEAAEWHRKRIEVNPKQKEAYYSLAVIEFAKWAPVWLQARAAAKMKTEDPGPIKDAKARAELKATYWASLEEAIQNLQKALDIDPEYNDAMAYTNLLIRQRADLYDTSDEYKKQIEIADGWLQKALDTAKIKAARAAKSTGIHAEAPK